MTIKNTGRSKYVNRVDIKMHFVWRNQNWFYDISFSKPLILFVQVKDSFSSHSSVIKCVVSEIYSHITFNKLIRIFNSNWVPFLTSLSESQKEKKKRFLSFLRKITRTWIGFRKVLLWVSEKRYPLISSFKIYHIKLKCRYEKAF